MSLLWSTCSRDPFLFRLENTAGVVRTFLTEKSISYLFQEKYEPQFAASCVAPPAELRLSCWPSDRADRQRRTAEWRREHSLPNRLRSESTRPKTNTCFLLRFDFCIPTSPCPCILVIAARTVIATKSCSCRSLIPQANASFRSSGFFWKCEWIYIVLPKSTYIRMFPLGSYAGSCVDGRGKSRRLRQCNFMSSQLRQMAIDFGRSDCDKDLEKKPIFRHFSSLLLYLLLHDLADAVHESGRHGNRFVIVHDRSQVGKHCRTPLWRWSQTSSQICKKIH